MAMMSNAQTRSRRRAARGFTLIELLVTLVIIGILASIAYPSYQNYMKRSRRATAQAFLMDVAQKEQEYLLDNRSYAPDLATLNMSTPSSVSTYYTITPTTSNTAPMSFTITATPIIGGAQAGDLTLSINNTGNKLPANAW
jgi:type IV pilus assembly protein PilE